MEHPVGLPHHLLLIVKCHAWFVFNGKKVETKPNMVVLFKPHTPIAYGCDVPKYNDDYIHVKFNEKDAEIFSQIDFPLNEPVYLSEVHSISRFVMSLTESYYSDSLHSKYIQDALIRTIIYLLDEERSKEIDAVQRHRYYSIFAKLRMQIYNLPLREWDVNQSAKSFMLSVSYFQHLYKLFFNRSFQTDVILSRLEYSKLWLTTSNYTIKGISEKCGYKNELHYMRQFKKYMKQTPTEYREKKYE
jgi:AraC family transcriptional regulator of arabinose operon